MQFSRPTFTLQYGSAVLLTLVVCCSACFVRNCPPGGKRSMDLPQIHSTRQCMRCGPQGLGQCFGPNICCGPSIGCYINTLESEECSKENDVRTPCDITAEICGVDGQGRCGADGVCCTDEKCTLDSSCDKLDMDKPRFSPDILRMLKKIFDRRSYPGRRK
uniref:Vasotocin-neurophysin n=2 Tax=Platynereis dumerilii TaxID=6359 RepID=A6YIC5_PLADU|nr:vasotocin-neurophysin [Platynereis dumerilii]